MYFSRVLLLVSFMSFMDPFSLKLSFEDAFLISSCQPGTKLFNFAFASKQAETRLSDNAVCHHFSDSEPSLNSSSFAPKDLTCVSLNV